MGVMFMTGNREELDFKKNRVLGEANCRNRHYMRLAGGKVIALGVVIRSETPQVLAVECESTFGAGIFF
jgi:hypothetical protein